MSVLRTQLGAAARRPSRLLLTGLAVLVASFVMYASVLAQHSTERTVLNSLSGTPKAVDLAVHDGAATTAEMAAITTLPGVAEVAGRVTAGGMVGAEYLNLTADSGTGPLSVATVVAGRYPSGPGEIAVTRRTADRIGLPVGSHADVSAGYTDDGKPLPATRLTVVGLVDGGDDFGGSAYAPLATVTALTKSDALDQIDVRLAPGADPAAVRTAIDGVIAAAPKPAADATKPVVSTGDDIRHAEAKAAVDDIDDLFALVRMFIAIALAAAALVATSTFRIVFAQRMRQLALLRAVGAGRGSIRRALAAEGALTGLVAGVVGVGLALGAGYLTPPVAGAFGVTLATPGVPLLPALGIIGLAVVITVLAVLAPAVSAARVAPLEALRSASTTGARTDIGLLRWITGLLLAAGAAAAAGYTVHSLPKPDQTDYNPGTVLLSIVGSGALAYFALVALGPVLVRPVLAVVGWPIRRSGALGRIAVGGVGGAPRRAAAVSVVVALGVTLVAGVVVGGASVRVLAERESALSSPADYELIANGSTPLSAAMVAQAKTSADLTRIAPYRKLDGITVGTAGSSLEATDLSLAAVPRLSTVDVQSGSLSALGPGTVILSSWEEFRSYGVGDTVRLVNGKRSVDLKVVARLPGSAPLGSSMVLDPSDLTRLGAPAAYTGMLADAAHAGETGRTAGRNALRQITAGGDGFGITVLADQRDEVQRNLTEVLAIAIGLVGLTVLIAVVGVGTTTALSVVERVRESGLLRAVGLSRGGLRVMLTTESALYGVVGAVIGLVLGVPYAWLAVKALGHNIPLQLPVGQLAVVFAVLVAFTALAGVLPARRAAKVSPVEALGSEM